MENNSNKMPFVSARIDRMLHGESAVKAFATVTIANSFAVHNVKVIEGTKGLFVSMPSQSYINSDGETKYSDTCHAVTVDMKRLVDAVVLKAYDIAQGQSQSATSEDITEADLARPLNVPTQDTSAPVAPVMNTEADYDLPFEITQTM